MRNLIISIFLLGIVTIFINGCTLITDFSVREEDSGVDTTQDTVNDTTTQDTQNDITEDTTEDTTEDIQSDIQSDIQIDTENDISQDVAPDVECIDNDGDDYGTNCAAGEDCDDTSDRCTTDCTTDVDSDNIADCKDNCIDYDSDNYGEGDFCAGTDCDPNVALCNIDCTTDANNNNHRDCDEGCDDGDGDGYGEGEDCLGEDCNDDIISCNVDCTTNSDNDSDPDCADTDDDNDGDPDTTDCNRTNPDINHSADEVCDGFDNNCDDQIDENFTDTDNDQQADCVDPDDDGDGDPDETDCAQLDQAINHSATELCDGFDNNCDDQIDENFTDTDNDQQADCVDPDDDDDGDPDETDCNDLNSDINHSADEVCDGVDNNCDDQIDENFTDTDTDGQADCVDLDDDNDGDADETDCDITNPDINHNAQEVCDGVDNNCDTNIDEGTAGDTDGDGQNDCVDTDDDDDTILDTEDNCPLIANSGQEDADSDNWGDACDCDNVYPTCTNDCSDNNEDSIPDCRVRTIRQLRAAPGLLPVVLNEVVVTMVVGAGSSANGYYIQDPNIDGDAAFVYTNTSLPDPVVTEGNELLITVTAASEYRGLFEITTETHTILAQTYNLENLVQDVSSSEIGETMESELIRIIGATVDTGNDADWSIRYNSGNNSINLYYPGFAALNNRGICSGATFDVTYAVVHETDGFYELRTFDGANFGNIVNDTCPQIDASNFNFENWTLSDPPEDFYKRTSDFTATEDMDSSHVADGTRSCNLTWTSQDNQDMIQAYFLPLNSATSCTFSLNVYDNDSAGQTRLGLYFYSADFRSVTASGNFSSTYSSDNATMQTYTFVYNNIPADAAYVRGLVRLYDVSANWDNDATVYIDSWSLTCN